MNADPEAAQSRPWKDRSTGLVIFGVLQMCMGGLALLVAAVSIFGVFASRMLGDEAAAGMNARTMAPAVVIYGLLGTSFVTIAIGSFGARRWARALVLIASWFWMSCGVVAVIGLVFMMDGVFAAVAAEGHVGSEVLRIMKISVAVLCAVIYIIIPGAHILFYRTRDVRETCNNRNPKPSWTDACPLPVLGLAMLFALWPLSTIYMVGYNWMFPFFGHVLSGLSGAMACLAFSFIGLFLAYGMYRCRPRAWRGAIVAVSLLGVSNLYTFATVDLMTIYEKMDFPEQQLAMMRQFANAPGANLIPLYGTALSIAGILGLLIYSRRYFVASS